MSTFKCCTNPPEKESEFSPPVDNNDGGGVDLTLRGVRNDPRLFEPVKVGCIECKNRVWMAPLTRLRADVKTFCVGDHHAKHYMQRASAGMVITEATGVMLGASGYQGAPSIYNQEQITAWKKVTAAVHKVGGKICLQMWHTGRIGHPSISGTANYSASELPEDPTVKTSLLDDNKNPMRVVCPASIAMTEEKIKETISAFAQATRNAKDAGFDMVEVHSAHGYLLHQFYSPSTNLRTDKYGGSLENRCRFPLEVLDACINAWDSNRIGIRISPLDEWQGTDNGPREEAKKNGLYYINEIAKRNIAYLHLSEGFGGPFQVWEPEWRTAIRSTFKGVIVANGDYDNEKVKSVFDQGAIDAITIGRRFMSNPDLIYRLQTGADLNPPAPGGKGIYGGHGDVLYNDFPSIKN